jgi:hypothetical protein
VVQLELYERVGFAIDQDHEVSDEVRSGENPYV